MINFFFWEKLLFFHFRTLSEKALAVLIFFRRGCQNCNLGVHGNNSRKFIFLIAFLSFSQLEQNCSGWCRNFLTRISKILLTFPKEQFEEIIFCGEIEWFWPFPDIKRQPAPWIFFSVGLSKLQSICPWAHFWGRIFSFWRKYSFFRTIRKKF